jgi:hypothetical protein
MNTDKHRPRTNTGHGQTRTTDKEDEVLREGEFWLKRLLQSKGRTEVTEITGQDQHGGTEPRRRTQRALSLATCRGAPRWMRGMRQIKTALAHEPL